MPRIVWDDVGEKVYETGLDRGVLYLSDGSGVPWNGLTSVVENSSIESEPVYYDGMKIHDSVTLGDFSATVRAITYPDEFLEIEGLASIRYGVFVDDQNPKLFGLSYRTKIGNDLLGDQAGYKINVIYNATAIPSSKSYATMKQEIDLTEFEWSVTTVPEEIPGLRPTSHFVIDSRIIDALLLADIEDILYGDLSTGGANLPPMSEFITYILDWV